MKYNWKRAGQAFVAYFGVGLVWMPVYSALGWQRLSTPWQHVALIVPIAVGQGLLMGWWVGREVDTDLGDRTNS